MGKLRTTLSALDTLLTGASKRIDDGDVKLTTLATNVQKHLERTNGGYELLAMYLKQKAGADFAAWQAEPLKAHFDTEVAGFVKNIELARSDAVAGFKVWADEKDKMIQATAADADKAGTLVADIEGQIAKKRAKWFQSKKFKSKIAGYEGQLDGLKKAVPNLKGTAKLVADQTQTLGPKGLEALRLTAATPISTVVKEAGPGIRAELQKIKKADPGKQLQTAFRRYGAELAGIRAWVNEADEMEAEAEETGTTGKPDPKPTISDISVKFGSTEVGRAAKGEYDRGTKMLVVSKFVWKLKGAAQLELLQKKVNVTGKYPADEGRFLVDMKVEGIKGDDILKLKAV